MGLCVDRDEFAASDYEAFAERLEQGLVALAALLRRPGFGEGPRSLGAELEFSLVGESGRPMPIGPELLAEADDPRLAPELDRFNLECNARPVPVAGRPFARLGSELEEVLGLVGRLAARRGGRPALIGILPTCRAEDLQRDAMTDLPRYRALEAGLRRLRQRPFQVRIHGADPLAISSDHVTFEGANTSLQLHLRVAPAEFTATYNAAQLATAPALAAAGNSPTFLGHRLWEETRVALFKQAVDERGGAARSRREPRVSFGARWLAAGPVELFAEAVRRHAPLLPVVGDENGCVVARGGGVPRLEELRLHQGTVWSWNRPVYDPDAGGHLRIELRALPAGPSVPDMLANAAFLLGLTLGLAPQAGWMVEALPFEQAEANFYRAAQSGLEARLHWPQEDGPPRELRAAELIPELLPVAARGLVAAGVEAEEARHWLDLLGARVARGMTGARWQRLALEKLEPERSREEALAAMLARYLDHAARGLPVHEWPLE